MAAPTPGSARLARDPARAVVAGVCAGVARRLGVDPILPRVIVVALSAFGGLGLAVYALGWALLPAGAAVARGRATGGRVQAALGAGLIALAALLVLREWGLWVGDAVAWPAVMAAAGIALLWRPAGSGRAEAATAGLYRGGFGLALLAGAALLMLLFAGALDPGLQFVVVALVGLGLVLAPLLWRAARSLTAEREARIRAEERAELGAHLHDSVLQTLAMVRKRAGDPRAVDLLARNQERDLRDWLAAGAAARPEERLADAVRAAAVAVELEHGARVELVCVGDAPLDERGRALVAAAREALVNAARFAPGAPVDAYLEVEPGGVRAFVRDRGPGFDPDAVPADRRGVRESILGRMRRHGGRATVRSTGAAGGGAGTEVELWLPAEPERGT